MKSCLNCEKEVENFANYCSWECQLDQATKAGGKIIAPNELPIACIHADGTMLEHEHANHPTYKFPVDVEFTGEKPKLDEWDDSFSTETHALIYTDGYIAVTLYEYTYATWSLLDGTCLGSRFHQEPGWKLSDDSIEKIKEIKHET